jgi:hypothetical protein
MGPPTGTDREVIRKIIREALCLNGACRAHEGAVQKIMEGLEPILRDLDNSVYSGAMGDDL